MWSNCTVCKHEMLRKNHKDIESIILAIRCSLITRAHFIQGLLFLILPQHISQRVPADPFLLSLKALNACT